MANVGPIIVLDTILGSSYLAIQASLKVLKPHNLDLSRCTITVAREEKFLVVLVVLSQETGDAWKGVRVQPGRAAELSEGELTELVSQLNLLETIDRIRGANLRAIQAAEGVFRARVPDLDLTQYKIKVLGEGPSVSVVFADKDRRPGIRGIVPGRPMAFEVELDPRDFSVRRSNFAR